MTIAMQTRSPIAANDGNQISYGADFSGSSVYLAFEYEWFDRTFSSDC